MGGVDPDLTQTLYLDELEASEMLADEEILTLLVMGTVLMTALVVIPTAAIVSAGRKFLNMAHSRTGKKD